MTRPTRAQIHTTRAVLRWYFDTHHKAKSDFGIPSTFLDPDLVGQFAITVDEYERADGPALFRMLVACAMFQRLRDQLILNILRRMPRREAAEIGSPSSLRALSAASRCEHMKTTHALRERCDLMKDANGAGCCIAQPRLDCHLKRHTVALKRYGHFGKMPTSLALAFAEHGTNDPAELLQQVVRAHSSKRDRSVAMEAALSKAWRVNQKVASMFLSLVSNPDMTDACNAPWSEDLDWSYFVVIDSNVDLFLTSIGYAGKGTYDARREFIMRLSAQLDLREFGTAGHAFNPRLVQQAMYMFMSKSNRRAAANDCGVLVPSRCGECPGALVRRCPVRPATRA